MIIEDDRTHLMLISDIIKKLDFNVISAESGKVSLEKLKEYGSNIGLILLDYEMPEMNGIETVRAIRSLEKDQAWRRTPVIAFTANREDSLHEQCLAAGMDDCLSKEIWMPKWHSSLEAIIEKWL